MEKVKFDAFIFSRGSREQAERQLSIFSDSIWGMACNWGARRYNLAIEDVEDQMQWTLNKIWNKREIFSSLPDIRGFLFKVLGWRCLQFIKRRRGFVSTAEALLEEESYYSNSYEYKNFTKAAIEHVSMRNPLLGRIMYMYYVEGYHSGEIEELCGIPQQVVNVNRNRALKMVREWFAEDEKSEFIIPPKDLWGKIMSAVYEVRIRVPRVKPTPRIKMRSFEEAREYARSLGLTSRKDWEDHCHTNGKPADIPLLANVTYANEFKGWEDFLGYEGLATYEEVETFMRTTILPLGITNGVQWRENYDRLRERGVIPHNIPKSVDNVYKDKGFVRWGIMMGTNRYMKRKEEEILPYEQAKEYVQRELVPLGIDSIAAWRENPSLIPIFLPVDPIDHYKTLYKGPSDFFGMRRNISKFSNVWPYEKARNWVIKNLVNSRFDISTSNRWMNYIAGMYPKAPRLPDSIPKDPRYYKKHGAQWIDWNHWFGIDEGLKQLEREALAEVIKHMRHDLLMTWEKIAEDVGASEQKIRKIYHEFVPEQERIGPQHARLLDERDVIKIRKLYDTGKYSRVTLGDMFGVSAGAIQSIVERKNWKHIA